MHKRLLAAGLGSLLSLGALRRRAFAITIEYALDRAPALVACDRLAYRGARAEARACFQKRSPRARIRGSRATPRARAATCAPRMLSSRRRQAVPDGRAAARALGRAVPRDASEQRGREAVQRGARARRGLRAREARARESRGRRLRGEGARVGDAGDRRVARLEPRGAPPARAHGSRGRQDRGRRREARHGARDRREAEAAAARDLRAQGVGGSAARQDRQRMDREGARAKRELRRGLCDAGVFLRDHAPLSRGDRALEEGRRRSSRICTPRIRSSA